ncbi:MAG: hypothetical protein LBU78_08320 [Microbacterium sp.]|nr:hypothetical protein [Microbacterium sp.]
MEENTTSGGLDRRTIIKGAAWSLPVVAVAAAVPMASASVAGATLAWGPSSGQLLSLALLNGAPSGGAVVNVNVLPNGANYFTVNNTTAGAVEGPLTGHVSVKWASGLPLLSVKGYGVYAVDGSTAAVTNRTETARGIGGLINTYETEQDIVVSQSIPGSTSVNIPITWGLTQNGSLGVSVLVSYTATLTLRDKNGVVIGSAQTTGLQVPVGLNIL